MKNLRHCVSCLAQLSGTVDHGPWTRDIVLYFTEGRGDMNHGQEIFNYIFRKVICSNDQKLKNLSSFYSFFLFFFVSYVLISFPTIL